MPTSRFGRLHIPFKKWANGANIPMAHQFEQDMLRIEDWADRLVDQVGSVGGLPFYVNGKRFEQTATSVGTTWSPLFLENDSMVLDTPTPNSGEGGRLWIVYISATFDLIIEPFSDVNDAKLDVECKIDPDTMNPYVDTFIAPISRETCLIKLNTFDSDVVNLSIPYEWMMVCYISDIEAPDDPEIPAVTSMSLRPELTVVFEAPGGDVETTELVAVDAQVVVHAFAIQDPNLVMSPLVTPTYDPDVSDGNAIPGYTVKYGGGGGGAEWTFTGGAWTAGGPGFFDSPEVGIAISGGSFGPGDGFLIPLELETVDGGDELNLQAGDYLTVTETGTYQVAVTVNMQKDGWVEGDYDMVITLISDYAGAATTVLATGTVTVGSVAEGAFAMTLSAEVELTAAMTVGLRFAYGAIDVYPSPESYEIISALNATATFTSV